MSLHGATVSSRFLRIFDAEAGHLPRAYWFLWGGTFVNRLGSWYPETEDGHKTQWGDEGDDRIGPSSRLDDLFDIR